MKYIENIVIRKPIARPSQMFAIDKKDWFNIEKKKTMITNERFLPRILIELGIYPSISEIRRNRKDLMVELNKVDFLELKVSKKRKLWILVGG